MFIEPENRLGTLDKLKYKNTHFLVCLVSCIQELKMLYFYFFFFN